MGGVIGSIKVVPQRSRANCLPAWTQVIFKERYSQTHTDLLVAVATRLPFTQPLSAATGRQALFRKVVQPAQFQPFSAQAVFERKETGSVPTGPAQAGN